MVRDNGGAIAQKGFNYQNHVISLTAIRNYTKNNFEIFVESDDDFEVLYDDNYHAYIQ
ncbi:dsDNA nuclease domain-containing protein, partial [Streptococcus salivarius]